MTYLGMCMKARTLSGVRMAGGGHNRHGLRWSPWGFGAASSTRGILIRIGFFGMLGVCTIVGDGLSGLVGVLELTSAISPAGDQTSESAA